MQRLLSLFAITSIAATTLTFEQRPAGTQKREEALAEALRTPETVVPPIPPEEKHKILQMKHVKHDPSTKPRSYSLRHAADQDGWLVFNQATEVPFQMNTAVISTNNGGVALTFAPLAVNKPHLVIFCVTIPNGSLQIFTTQSTGPGVAQTVTETQTVTNGQPAYVPVMVTPSTNTKLVSVEIENSPSTALYFTFTRATVELVQP